MTPEIKKKIRLKIWNNHFHLIFFSGIEYSLFQNKNIFFLQKNINWNTTIID